LLDFFNKVVRSVKMGERTAFFYGTLMVPQVLQRVTNLPSIAHLKIYPAILPDHSRHHVRYADYPGMIAHPGSSVRGTYVVGLSDRDVGRLDTFEGSQYVRVKVQVWLLPDEDAKEGKATEEAKNGGEHEYVAAETYIFKDENDLLKKEWDYEVFKREKMSRWVGESDEYDDLSDTEEELEEEATDEGGDSKALPTAKTAEEKEILESAV